MGNYLSHRKPGIGFEFGDRVLKFQFQFILFLPKVVGRFWHDPNGTPSGPSIRFTMPVNGIAAATAAAPLAMAGAAWMGSSGVTG
jgi:hypothetical protein